MHWNHITPPKPFQAQSSHSSKFVHYVKSLCQLSYVNHRSESFRNAAKNADYLPDAFGFIRHIARIVKVPHNILDFIERFMSTICVLRSVYI